jgi:MarR family transcriptional regulator, organic hydroperoxide resistance regulator
METEVRGNVGFLIWRVSMRWRAAMDRTLAPLGLTHAQYSVLAPLYGMSVDGARPSQRELADFTGLDPVYISKLVRALEREGFLTRSVKASDPRAVELALTTQGADAVQEGIRLVTAMRDRLTRPLGGNGGARTAELARLLLELVDAPEADG